MDSMTLAGFCHLEETGVNRDWGWVRVIFGNTHVRTVSRCFRRRFFKFPVAHRRMNHEWQDAVIAVLFEKMDLYKCGNCDSQYIHDSLQRKVRIEENPPRSSARFPTPPVESRHHVYNYVVCRIRNLAMCSIGLRGRRTTGSTVLWKMPTRYDIIVQMIVIISWLHGGMRTRGRPDSGES